MQATLYRVIVIVFCMSFIVGSAVASSNDAIESENEVEVKVPGEYIKAWNIAYSAFMEIDDLLDEQRKLKYYDIEFNEDEENYIVFFFPRLMVELVSEQIISEKEAKKYRSRVLGRETRYWINKDSYKVVKRLFYK